ncbi:hypothetical protein DDE05_29215 [Streptomyces cavourensis]|nr:hypothetical protein DDE05_29215 [Streptomyces cavourensis]
MFLPNAFRLLPRPLSAALLLAAALPVSAQADEQCVAQFDASVARYKEAVTVQTKREVTNLHQLNSLLCQGRLDLLDMEFALVDDYEQCTRDGGQFPDRTVQSMTTLPDNLAAKKTTWIDTCGPYMKQP